MKTVLAGLVGGLLLIVGLGPVASAAAAACPPDSVQSGTACMDKYEASVWYVPPTEHGLINKIQKGEVKLTDLTSPRALEVGVVQLGLASGDLAAAGCPITANGCVDFYAVSIAGVTPAAFINWFQAAAAARNSRKRLATNQEWQVAALGTPSASCNVSGVSVANTGSAAGCVSDVGASDMVGNLWEWVADWVPRSTGCGGSWGLFSDDHQCLVGAETTGAPGALVRGGHFVDGADAGVFAVRGGDTPSSASFLLGFRAAR